MTEFFREVVFQDASQLLAEISPWTAPVDLSQYIFRGHSDDEYKLVPTALRPDAFWEICGGRPIPDQIDFEYLQCTNEFDLLREFYKSADRRGLGVPAIANIRRNISAIFDFNGIFGIRRWIPDELLELASLAQHYGVPTRLLDWTYDPFVAAYFAAASAKSGKDLSIWALNAPVIHDWQLSGLSVPVSLVTPPYADNPNLAAQSGIFTSWGIDLLPIVDQVNCMQKINRTPLDSLLKQFVESHQIVLERPVLLKLRLPGAEGRRVLRLLQQAGYGAARIFPGYGGVAQEVLNSRHF